jgi:hypothetical protein
MVDHQYEFSIVAATIASPLSKLSSIRVSPSISSSASARQGMHFRQHNPVGSKSICPL